MVKAVDIDGNGTIDFIEFLSMMSTIGSVESGQELVEEFKEFDKNGDGLVSVSELKYVMAKLGTFFFIEKIGAMVDVIFAVIGERLSDEQVAEIVRMADVDGDGQINYHGRCQYVPSRKSLLIVFDSIEFVKVFASPDQEDVPDNRHDALDDDGARIMIEDGGHGWDTVLMYSYTTLVFLIICTGPWRK